MISVGSKGVGWQEAQSLSDMVFSAMGSAEICTPGLEQVSCGTGGMKDGQPGIIVHDQGVLREHFGTV